MAGGLQQLRTVMFGRQSLFAPHSPPPAPSKAFAVRERDTVMVQLLGSEPTSFTLDNMGRFLCNTLQEARNSAGETLAGRKRDFDIIVIGGGTFGAVIADRLFTADLTRSRRILVLEAGTFVLPEHMQNMPFLGGAPDLRVPWVNHPALNYSGLIFAIGGRSLTWGGWSPELLDSEMNAWPAAARDALRPPPPAEGYF